MLKSETSIPEKWYQRYSLKDTYLDPKTAYSFSTVSQGVSKTFCTSQASQSDKTFSPGDEISAVEFINWIKGHQNQDCRYHKRGS